MGSNSSTIIVLIFLSWICFHGLFEQKGMLASILKAAVGVTTITSTTHQRSLKLPSSPLSAQPTNPQNVSSSTDEPTTTSTPPPLPPTKPPTVSSSTAEPATTSTTPPLPPTNPPQKNHLVITATTATTEIKQREKVMKLHLSNSTDKAFSHFFSHLPKSGSTFALREILRLLFLSNEFRAIPEDLRFRPCGVGQMLTRNFHGKYPDEVKRTKCTMWMSEQPAVHGQAQHNYIILRDPVAHTLSNYFHCKESKNHRKYSYRMPPLDQWLDAWVDALTNQTKADENGDFYCYDPRDFESRFVGFNASAPLAESKQMLKQKFDVIGDQSQMDKTVCMIHTRYAGWVPDQCDCTDRRRRLNRDDHGVTNHGDTFNLTNHQRQKIAKLRSKDAELYKLGREIFAEQVAEVEQTFQVKLCDTYQKRVAEVDRINDQVGVRRKNEKSVRRSIERSASMAPR